MVPTRPALGHYGLDVEGDTVRRYISKKKNFFETPKSTAHLEAQFASDTTSLMGKKLTKVAKVFICATDYQITTEE